MLAVSAFLLKNSVKVNTIEFQNKTKKADSIEPASEVNNLTYVCWGQNHRLFDLSLDHSVNDNEKCIYNDTENEKIQYEFWRLYRKYGCVVKRTYHYG